MSSQARPATVVAPPRPPLETGRGGSSGATRVGRSTRNRSGGGTYGEAEADAPNGDRRLARRRGPHRRRAGSVDGDGRRELRGDQGPQGQARREGDRRRAPAGGRRGRRDRAG